MVRHYKLVLVISGIVIVGSAAAVVHTITTQKPTSAIDKPIVKVVEKPKPVVPTKYYSPLTGKLVANETATKQPVTGVMIENSPDARPQSGLKDSGVVFEAIAEGGITRFLVLYQAEKPQLIGPVRSLRLYDVDWLAAFNSSIAHVGGSLFALNEIRNGSYRDIDQFFNPNSYWRASDRYAPHNVYTSFANLDALNKSKGYTSSSFTGFTRVDGKASTKPTATNIDITISSYLYNSNYIYNAKTNTYARSQAGAPHTDRESGQITPSVVITMRVNETTELQDGYREAITTIGSGNATIFQNGTATAVTWHKTSKTSQITFKNAAGKDVPLVSGQTWIAAVSNDGGDVTWK
ncbi:hypothetical protein AUK57_03095 [Candidatus Saccharibacteria bacterium CG2_30_41_52]|nr:MAG: hypothetical protein AUK57_03095 [Candidatus Saccharibacteria bacterium CG2_30_41_52]